MRLRDRSHDRIKVCQHPIIAVLVNFVHFLDESAKIGDNSSILGAFLNTVNRFPTENTVHSVEGRAKRQSKVHEHPIISPCSNSCIRCIKVRKSETILQFWGTF